jgi:hypothetical protein
MTSPKTLNTKVAANKLSFPLVTHMVYSDAWFDSYGILNSGWGGGTETPVLGELNQSKNSKILPRNQEITNKVLGVALTVALERKERGLREKGEQVSSVQVVKLVKTG